MYPRPILRPVRTGGLGLLVLLAACSGKARPPAPTRTLDAAVAPDAGHPAGDPEGLPAAIAAAARCEPWGEFGPQVRCRELARLTRRLEQERTLRWAELATALATAAVAPEPRVRLIGARLLDTRLGDPPRPLEPVPPALLAAARHLLAATATEPDPRVRTHVIPAAFRLALLLGPELRSEARTRLAGLADPERRAAALRVLFRGGRLELLPELRAAAEPTAPEPVRIAVAEAFAGTTLAPAERGPACELLASLTRDPVARVSAAALGRLCQLCGAAAVSPLLPSLDERRRARTLDREHVLGLRELLQRGSPLPPADRQPIVALLEAAARDRLQPPLLREAAVFALWRFDPARAFPQARKLLADPDPTVKAAAQSVLKRQRPR
jgi:hypothetical protein